MPTSFSYPVTRRRDTRKIWRYPGVPIPDRLRSRYRVA